MMSSGSALAAPPRSIADRYAGAALVASGMVTALAALAFAASYVDGGYDHTCGSLLEPSDIYGDCAGVLRLRVVIGFAMVGIAIVLIIRGCVGRPIARGWLVVAAVSPALSGVVLVVNEVVRSGGLL